MKKGTISQLHKNISLKTISLILGYFVWYLLGKTLHAKIQVQVPLCFYGLSDHQTCQGPDTITVKLFGKREDLYTLCYEELGIHIDAQTLHPGTNHIRPTTDTLFLPEAITLVHYEPSPIMVELQDILIQS